MRESGAVLSLALTVSVSFVGFGGAARYIIPIPSHPHINTQVEQTLAGHSVRLLSKAPLPRLDLPKIRRNPFVEIIPLSTGCLGACTYCKTRHARGKLGSYAVEAIVGRAQAVVEVGGWVYAWVCVYGSPVWTPPDESPPPPPRRRPVHPNPHPSTHRRPPFPQPQTTQEGVTELWLSSEDTGAYGRDLFPSPSPGPNPNPPGLTRLLAALLPTLPPRVMLRLGMTNPPFILDQLESVAAALRHPNVFSFLHIPVQAGSDAVGVGCMEGARAH